MRVPQDVCNKQVAIKKERTPIHKAKTEMRGGFCEFRNEKNNCKYFEKKENKPFPRDGASPFNGKMSTHLGRLFLTPAITITGSKYSESVINKLARRIMKAFNAKQAKP
jgi:hypothetical protein